MKQLNLVDDPLVEQLRLADEGVRVTPPNVNWGQLAAQRLRRRRRLGIGACSLALLGLVAPLAWLTTRSSVDQHVVHAVRESSPRDKLPLLDTSRRLEVLKEEIADLDQQIRDVDGDLATLLHVQRLLDTPKAAMPAAVDFSDPVEEGALVLLAAAQRAERREGKSESLTLYRRVLEIFPETRSAEVARRQLM